MAQVPSGSGRGGSVGAFGRVGYPTSEMTLRVGTASGSRTLIGPAPSRHGQLVFSGFSARLSERRRQQLSTFRFTPQILAPPVEPEPEKQMGQWVHRELEALRPGLPLKGPDR